MSNTRETVVTTSKETTEVRNGVTVVKQEHKTIKVRRDLPVPPAAPERDR